MDQDHAIVVGITHYPQLRTLHGAERDADAFCDWLKSPRGGQVPEANINRIVSSLYDPAQVKPTTDIIDMAFMDIVRRGRQNEGRLGRRLYLYFSGHGISPDLDPDDAALLMANAARDLPGFHIPGRLYASYLRVEGLFNDVVLFMDCCRDDYAQAAKHPAPWTPSPSRRGGQTRHFYGFATTWGAEARELPIHEGKVVPSGQGVVSGVFTVALMEALWGRNADAQRRVTGKTIHDHVRNRVVELLAGRELETPQFAPAGGEDFVFVEKADPTPRTQVVIRVAPTRTADVLLLGAKAELIATLKPGSGPTSIDFEPGLYMLRDSGTTEEKGFQVLGKARDDIHF
jgi:hypothetical protein